MVAQLPRRLFATLASRIGFFVFAATLAGALAVAGTSALALRTFLRAQTEDRILDASVAARDRLDLWCAQRLLDIEVFAHSELVVSGLTRLSRRGGPGGADRAEVEQYLGYVRDGLPMYAAIFALDHRGRRIASVGSAVSIDDVRTRELVDVSESTFSGFVPLPSGDRAQVISAPVGSKGAVAASLHALVPVAELRAQLRNLLGDATGRVHVFDARGTLVASSVEGFEGTLPEAVTTARSGSTVEYSAADGVRVVASGLLLERFGWQVVYERDYGSSFAAIKSILTRTVAMNVGIAILLAALAFAAARSMLRPLRLLSKCAVRLRDGETDVALPVVRADHEIGTLARSFAEMVDSLTRANEVLGQLAITDGLTKIHNHRHFQDELASAIEEVESADTALSLILVDIDDFKALNDRFGHAAGDCILEELAALLNANVRPSDVLARYGGEEFAVLLPETELEAAIVIAEQIRLAVHEGSFRDGGGEEPIRITVSVGVAVYRGDRVRFFEEADQALYAAKHAGKDCVQFAQA